MLENLNSYLDDPVDGNRQDDEVEIDLLEIFYVLKSKFLILLTVFCQKKRRSLLWRIFSWEPV